MVKKKRKVTRKRRTVKKKNGFFKIFLKYLSLYILLPGAFVLVAYLGYLDYTVRRQFEGKRWAIPARVYASPEEFYESRHMSLATFIKTLQQLGYRQDAKLSKRASYYKKGAHLYLKTKGFKSWDSEEPSRLLRITFKRNKIVKLFDLESSKDIAIFRLEPLQIGNFYPSRKEDRILVKLRDVPKRLVEALLAIEDHSFYQHRGISFRAIGRAIWANIQAGTVVQGGSTITQQLVKNFYLSSQRSFWRKFNEACMALILEARYNKDEILEAYLNEVYLGQDRSRAIHGFGLASEYYFNRPLNDLHLDEVAVLAGLVKGPSYYSPRKHPKRAIARRNLVLDTMLDQGFVSENQIKQSKRRPLGVTQYRGLNSSRYAAFIDLVKEQIKHEYKEDDLTSEGLRIFTTLTVGVQEAVAENAARILTRLEKRKGTENLQVAAVVIRREGGEVVAVLGGRNPQQSGFNRAIRASRAIGSLIKPAIYLSALEQSDKYSLTTVLDDSEIEIKTKTGKLWKPRNYDRKAHGEVFLHTALANSYNLATVRLGLDVGLAHTAKTLKNLGITRSVNLYPSMLLGAVELTPLEVAQMYQTIASDGFNTAIRTIRAVTSKDGKSLQRFPLTVRQVVDPAAVYLLNTVLQEVVRAGTGKSIYTILPESLAVAGKTGTSNDYRDSWFAGFSGDYLGVFWLGRDDNKPIRLSGASGALIVWANIMKKISQLPVQLVPPENVEFVWIDQKNGLKTDDRCATAVQYPYIKGSAPVEISSCTDNFLEGSGNWFRKFFGN